MKAWAAAACSAACVAARRPARVVVVSDGAGSHPNSPQPGRATRLRGAAAGGGADGGRDSRPRPGARHRLPRPAGYRGADGGGRISSGRGDPAAARQARPPRRQRLRHLAARPAPRPSRPASPSPRRRCGPGRRRRGSYAYPVWGLAFAHPIPGFPLPAGPRLPAPPRGFRLDITQPPAGQAAGGRGACLAGHRR